MTRLLRLNARNLDIPDPTANGLVWLRETKLAEGRFSQWASIPGSLAHYSRVGTLTTDGMDWGWWRYEGATPNWDKKFEKVLEERFSRPFCHARVPVYTPNIIAVNRIMRRRLIAAMEDSLRIEFEPVSSARAWAGWAETFYRLGHTGFLSDEVLLRAAKELLGLESYRSVPVNFSALTFKQIEVEVAELLGGHIVRLSGNIEVRGEVNDLVAHTVKEAYLLMARFHIKFESIHPFIDGNGRLGRALLFFLAARFGVNPPHIRFEDRNEYIATIAGKNEEALAELFQRSAEHMFL